MKIHSSIHHLVFQNLYLLLFSIHNNNRLYFQELLWCGYNYSRYNPVRKGKMKIKII